MNKERMGHPPDRRCISAAARHHISYDDSYVGAIASWLRGGIDLDGSLLYGTGGVAVLEANFDNDGCDNNETFVGWTAGLGFEQMISESCTWRIEALYADLGSVDFDDSESFDEPVPGTTNTHTDIDADMFIVRAGISLRL